MGVVGESGPITSRSWQVLRQHPYLLGFPVAAGVAGTAVTLLATGLVVGRQRGVSATLDAVSGRAEGGGGLTVIDLLVLAAGLLLAVIATQFLMGALVFCASEELHGRRSTFTAGISAAEARLVPLAGWAVTQAAYGWVLSGFTDTDEESYTAMRRRISLFGFIRLTWGIFSLFVLPFIMLRRLGTGAAKRASEDLLRATWGDNAGGHFRTGVHTLVLILPGLVLYFLGLQLTYGDNATVVGGLLLLASIVVLVSAAVAASTARAIFGVELFTWATEGEAAGSFSANELRAVIRPRQSAAHPRSAG